MSNKIFRSLLDGFIEKHRSEENCNCEVNRMEFTFHPSNEVILVNLICQNTYGSRYLVACGKVFFSRLPKDVRCDLIRMGAGEHSI
jgi:hypothetical protein